jgi:hypothetical protein
MLAITIRCELDDSENGEAFTRRGFITLLDQALLSREMGDFLDEDPNRVVLHVSQVSGGNDPASDIARKLRASDRKGMIEAAAKFLAKNGGIEWRWSVNHKAREIQPANVPLGAPSLHQLATYAFLAGLSVDAETVKLAKPEEIRSAIETALNAGAAPSASTWRCSIAELAPFQFEWKVSILAGELRYQRAKSTSSAAPQDSTPNLILEGVPGTGKSHAIAELRRSTYGDRVTTVVMHPATGYEDLIEGVRPANGDLGNAWNLKPKQDARYFHECYGRGVAATPAAASSAFVVRGGHFLIACAEACARPEDRFLLVLDEINRCNVPRAFGELLLLIEASKRWRWVDGKWKGEHGATLPYSGLTFFVPDNLHVLGTMNTTDRSVAPLDQALRRRFAFQRLEPMSDSALKTALGTIATDPLMDGGIAAWHSLNAQLEDKVGPDMMLGHSYFFDAARSIEGGRAAADALRDMWRLAVLPQLIDILHTANRASTADHQPLVEHLQALGLQLERKGEGLHELLRIKTSPVQATT